MAQRFAESKLDGRYAVTSDEDRSRLKRYELPLHRSMLFMAIGSAVWMLLAAIFCRRRRLALFEWTTTSV